MHGRLLSQVATSQVSCCAASLQSGNACNDVHIGGPKGGSHAHCEWVLIYQAFLDTRPKADRGQRGWNVWWCCSLTAWGGCCATSAAGFSELLTGQDMLPLGLQTAQPSSRFDRVTSWSCRLGCGAAIR